jgi:hypothetical protein
VWADRGYRPESFAVVHNDERDAIDPILLQRVFGNVRRFADAFPAHGAWLVETEVIGLR